MLTIQIVNKGNDEKGLYKYAYSVYVNDAKIAEGDYEGHNRDDGWAALVMDIASRNLNEQASKKIYCPHCGEYMSDHCFIDLLGYCEPK